MWKTPFPALTDSLYRASHWTINNDAVAIWPVTGQGLKTLNGRQSHILGKFHKIERFMANLNYHMSIKTSQAILKCFINAGLRRRNRVL